MADLLDKENLHTFLEKMNNKNNSFIANVNSLVLRLEDILKLNSLFNSDNVKDLSDLAQIDITTLIGDLKKGSYNNNRKLDIDLLLNFIGYDESMTDEEKRLLWNDPTKQVYYDSISVTFLDSTRLNKTFSTLINNHHKLYIEIEDWVELQEKATNTIFNTAVNTPIFNHELFRIVDAVGTVGSEIATIQLHVAPQGQNTNYDSVFAGAKSYTPSYTWLDTSSMISILAARAERLIQLSLSTDKLGILVTYLKELLAIADALDKLVGNTAQDSSIYNSLNELIEIHNNLAELLALYAQMDVLVELSSTITTLAETERNSIVALSIAERESIAVFVDDLRNTLTIESNNQVNRVITEGDIQVTKVKNEGDTQRIIVTNTGATFLTNTQQIIADATAQADRAKAEADRASSVVDLDFPEIQATGMIYFNNIVNGVPLLGPSEPTAELNIPVQVTSSSTAQVIFEWTSPYNGVVSPLSTWQLNLYMDSLQNNQQYMLHTTFRHKNTGKLLSDNDFTNAYSITNPLIQIPMPNNTLTEPLVYGVGEVFEVVLIIRKASGGLNTINIISSPTTPSNYTRNSSVLDSSNIIDFNGTNLRTQEQRNVEFVNSVIDTNTRIDTVTTLATTANTTANTAINNIVQVDSDLNAKLNTINTNISNVDVKANTAQSTADTANAKIDAFVSTPIYDQKFMPFRSDKLPTGWYPCFGERVLLTSPQGQKLKAASTEYKADWGIVADATTINYPNLLSSDGRGYFVRSVNGVTRQVGSVETDAIQQITGEARTSVGTFNRGDFYFSGAFTTGTFTTTSWLNYTSAGMCGAYFDASRVARTASETRPLNIGMTPAIFLGV